MHFEVLTPTKLDGRQEELLLELARLRGEQHVSGAPPTSGGGGLFTRLRDAFKAP